MNQPFVYVVLFFLSGIVSGSYFPWAILSFFFIGCLGSLILAFFYRRSKRAPLWFGLFLFFAGGLSAQVTLTQYPQHHISKWLSQESAHVELQGFVRDLPYRMQFESKAGRTIRKIRVPFEIENLKTDKGWEKASGKTILDFYYASKAVGLKIGDKVECRAQLKFVKNNPYGRYLKRQRILVFGSVSGKNATQWLGPSNRFWLKRKFSQLRSFLEKKLAYGLEKPSHRQILMGLVFGTRASFSPDLKDLLMQTNTYHIMAISGFNMALVIAIFTAFFTALGLPTRWVAFLMMGLVVFYMALVGWPPSATRAGLMSLVALLGWALNREVLSLNTVAISAFLILLVSPMQLFMPGFQLSYVVVLALVFWVNPLYQKMKELLFKSSSPHPVIATFILATCVSCIAWLSVLPITLCTFGTFALYSIFANLIIAGIVTLLTSLGIVALGVNLLNVNWGIYFNEVNEMLMEGLLGVLRLFQMLPGAYWEITPLPNFILIIYYFILLYFLYDKIKLRT